MYRMGFEVRWKTRQFRVVESTGPRAGISQKISLTRVSPRETHGLPPPSLTPAAKAPEVEKLWQGMRPKEPSD